MSWVAEDELALDALVKAVTSGSRDARIHASEGLIRGEAVKALPKLREHVKHPDPDVRVKVIEIMSALGGENEVPGVSEALEDEDVNVRLAAVKGLRKLQLHTAGRLDFEERLTDPNPHVRAASARTLGDLGRKQAVPKLITLLIDEHAYVRGAAAEALGKLGDDSAVPPLIQVLSGDQPVKGLVIRPTDELLNDIARLKEVEQKIEVVRALGHLQATNAIIPIVEHGLQASYPDLRGESAVALARIDDPQAIVPLQDALRPFYEAVGDAGVEEASVAPASAVPDTLRDIQQSEARARATVAWALGELPDPSSIPILAKAANDENNLVRDAAREALAKISEQQDRLALIEAEAKIKAAENAEAEQ